MLNRLKKEALHYKINNQSEGTHKYQKPQAINLKSWQSDNYWL